MHSAHCMLTLLSCSDRARLVEDSVTSMSKFPASFNLAWHDVHSLISCRKHVIIRLFFCRINLWFAARGYTVYEYTFQLSDTRLQSELRLPASLQQETGRVNVSSVLATSAEKWCSCCKSPTQTRLSPSSLSQPSQPVWANQLHSLLPSPDEQHAENLHLRNEKTIIYRDLDRILQNSYHRHGSYLALPC